MSNHEIQNVSDTALWVAVYRALESERKDALFQDPYAKRLAGERGMRIAESMKATQYVSWSVVIRTHVIDSMIHDYVFNSGVDTVLNLGAGLDTRPYRMNLPKDLKWIEIDFPHMVEMKEAHLKDEKPTCQLRRIKLDLSNSSARRKIFSEINQFSQRVLVLTEGVVPYLTNDQAAELAEALHAQPRFRFWILDYFSKEVMRYTRKSRAKQMKNAPMQFEPPDNWFSFFEKRGWTSRQIQYLGEESERLGREIPAPWFFKLLRPFIPAKRRNILNRFMAYVVLDRNS